MKTRHIWLGWAYIWYHDGGNYRDLTLRLIPSLWRHQSWNKRACNGADTIVCITGSRSETLKKACGKSDLCRNLSLMVVLFATIICDRGSSQSLFSSLLHHFFCAEIFILTKRLFILRVRSAPLFLLSSAFFARPALLHRRFFSLLFSVRRRRVSAVPLTV